MKNIKNPPFPGPEIDRGSKMAKNGPKIDPRAPDPSGISRDPSGTPSRANVAGLSAEPGVSEGSREAFGRGAPKGPF